MMIKQWFDPMVKKLAVLLPLLLLAPAITLAVGQQTNTVKLPKRGALKSNVESTYGDPKRILGPVGNPPITQWIYDQFTVVFEHNHVVHAYTRDFNLENRPASAIPSRPDLTLPSRSNNSPSSDIDSATMPTEEPEPALIDDREEFPANETEPLAEDDSIEENSFNEATPQDSKVEQPAEFDTIFDSEPSDDLSLDDDPDPEQ